MSEEESQGLNMVLLIQVPLKRKEREIRLQHSANAFL